MSSERKDLRYFLSFLRRRKWEIVFPTAALLGLTALIISMIAPAFRSTATILIEEQEIPSELVRSTISSYADQRIQVISRQVVTRANLQQIIRKYNLYPRQPEGALPEAVIQKVRKNINLEMLSAEVTDKRSGSKTTAAIAFVLSYEGETAKQAQEVTGELVSLYLGENLKARQQQAADAARLLGEEARRLEAQITEIEKNLALFKERNAGQLPELAQVNLQLRERSEAEILETERQITGLLQRQADLETQLSLLKPHAPGVSASGERLLEPEERLRLAQAQYASLSGIYSPDHPDVQRLKREIEGLQRQVVSDRTPLDQAREIERVARELAALRQRYAEEHPDVIKLKAQLEALQNSQASSPPSVTASLESRGKRADNPAYITVRTQLASLRTELSGARARQSELRVKLLEYERRLRETPQAERQYQDITRERENATRRYQEVRAKLMEAQVAQTLERDSKAERFSVLEPPNLPERPVRPNRLALAMLGSFLAVGAGLAFAGIREALDNTIHNVDQLAAALRAPVLAAIPRVRIPKRTARKLQSL
jgi:polysaccharide biosynthesis transport protein